MPDPINHDDTNIDHQNGDPAQKPLDPAVERVRRKLMRLMLVSIVIMVVSIGAVLVAVIYKVSGQNDTADDQQHILHAQIPGSSAALVRDYVETDIDLPQQAQLVDYQLSQNYLTMHITLQDGSHQILVYDLNSNKLISRLHLQQAN